MAVAGDKDAHPRASEPRGADSAPRGAGPLEMEADAAGRLCDDAAAGQCSYPHQGLQQVRLSPLDCFCNPLVE